MQTTFQRMRVAFLRFWGDHGAFATHILVSITCILVIAALLETFLFNMNYWATAGLDSIDLSGRMSLQQNSDGTYKITEADHTIEFNDLNEKVSTIWLDFDDEQAAQVLNVTIQFTDDAHATYFESNEYSAGVPVREVATNDGGTEHIRLSTKGMTSNLRIEISGEDISYPITLNGVYINATFPFHFIFARFAFCALVLGVAYAFRPKSAVYRIRIVEHPHLSKGAVIAAVVLEIVLVSGYLFMGSNQVGVATSFYNSGSWDRQSIANTFDAGGDNAQQYAELARAMADGQLYLEVDPPDWLVQMDNPYDKGLRDEAQKETGESYLWDVAYYDGHYYVYFGVVPVILLYLPFYLLTGANFPTAIGVWLACILMILGCTALLDRFARYHFKRVSLGLYLLLQMPLVCCSGILYLVKFPNFYSLPIMMALAFSVWGLYLWMRGRRDERPIGWYLGGSTCMALVLGCRPQLMVLSFVAFPLFWRRYITRGRIRTARGAREFACLIAPYVLVGLGIMAYNHARFGSFFDFGSNYNLTMNDMTQRGWDWGRTLPALFAFFVQSPAVSGVFPYLQAVSFATTYMGQTIHESTFGGLFACLPLLWIIFFSVPIIRMRVRDRETHTIAGIVVVLLISGIVVGVVDAQMAGILQRYFADFSLLFLLVAVLLCFIVNENMDQAGKPFALMMRVLPVLVFVGLSYSLLLCLVAEVNWYSDVYDWAYVSIIHMFQFWT